ncbi:MAG: phosphoglycerate kinase [Alphaproteobacteria bacterium]|jgi:phosphoglycerate kinase|nr:phosphoglycerate kinase [Alphaproteobacteria bacterium]MDP6254326.1 phosphoglycerate kinase [Alphaproteobacteria bacterium]MDP7054922.1 phosphoglycerate kinase [Alphaproteobacteria bacterium]MDP7227798.1 phosphoglycerate kinase [Alphaproteobacteria bacterium]MDP7461965.1 phosphoglycerate kinase [Alphaproteobacteria bacterium]|tara:strand:- start:2278 stop:3453 length:1176 start_codon:yes stop_codon:yes gene_type:complete
MQTLDDLTLAGQRVLVRVDLNVPMRDGRVSDATRIERAVPTLAELVGKGAKVIVLSHFGQPKGQVVPNMSLAPLAGPLAAALERPVAFAAMDTAPAVVAAMNDGDVLLLENVRFDAGEEANDGVFAQRLADLGDIYVNDAFSCAHRAHTSTEAIAHLLPAAAGRSMQAELTALEAALANPRRPMAALVGGAKVSSKLAVLGHLLDKVDQLIIGGGMANTFLFAKGINVGASLCETDLADTAREIMAKAGQTGCEIVLPVDVVLAREFKAGMDATTVPIDKVPDDMMILDVGPASVWDLAQRLQQYRTLLWNGPMGAFEIAPFDNGTVKVAQAAAARSKAGNLTSVAGGGDTVAALRHAGAADDFTYVSTAGGAFLEWLEGKVLPGIKALED